MTRLTNEQKQQQEAAAYGLPLQQRQPLNLDNLTHEQIEAIRGVVFKHDAQNAAMTREFDLNKPPTPRFRCPMCGAQSATVAGLIWEE